jgi:hypothetical protein
VAETSASVYQAALVTLPCAGGVFGGTASAIRILALPQLMWARVATDYKTNGVRVKTIRCGNQMKPNIDISPGEYRYCLERIFCLIHSTPKAILVARPSFAAGSSARCGNVLGDKGRNSS